MSSAYDLGTNLVRRIYEKRIDAPAILDAGTHFPNATKFAAAWRSIREEALSVQLNRVPRFHDIMPE
ncbi:MAG: aspartyl/asparaginyl beta-hydroxylase domain-containing protein, partial [Mesorhizobium sp.]